MAEIHQVETQISKDCAIFLVATDFNVYKNIVAGRANDFFVVALSVHRIGDIAGVQVQVSAVAVTIVAVVKENGPSMQDCDDT